MNPFFSVIIPLYNKEKFIKTTIQSVLSQTFGDFEIVVINDGSTDKSEQNLLEINDARIRYFKTENKGVSVARNLGIEKSLGQFICFLDADDYWYPHFLSELHKHIELLPEQKVFACAIEFETEGEIIPSMYSIERQGDYQIVDYFQSSLKQSVLWTSSSAFAKSAFEKSGVFNSDYKAGEDTDLWVRIGIHFPVVFIWKIGARYVYDQNSLSINRSKMSARSNFTEYIEEEKSNIHLKKFLDYNRFSLAIESKLHHEKDKFNTFYKQINMSSLPLRKQLLLHLPTWILLILIKTKNKLTQLGMGNSVFR